MEETFTANDVISDSLKVIGKNFLLFMIGALAISAVNLLYFFGDNLLFSIIIESIFQILYYIFSIFVIIYSIKTIEKNSLELNKILYDIFISLFL